MAHPVHVTDNTFQVEVLDSQVPVLVDFWATWCGPCRLIAPVIEELSTQYDSQAKMCKVDVDNNQQIAMQYGIRSIPTLLFFNKGEVVDTIIGNMPKSQIEEHLKALL
ncbi:MAG: thioredoxin [Ignavibacteriae bacterium]|nr:thioredoxin [Ignavibacteriota bacterium]